MKLKYYLRGIGIGIIFATLVMTVSSLVHKYNITDEYIIKEARKLGMVMKEELKDSESIWGKDETEADTEDTESTQVVGSEVQPSESESTSESPKPSESESESQTPPVSESPKPSESESESQAPTPSESESESQAPTPSESESESQTPPVSETPNPSESESESQAPSEEVTYVTVTIERGDYARQVAEKVRAAGLIEDTEDFRKYIGAHGYGQRFHAGSYRIPMGADYEEICKILTS